MADDKRPADEPLPPREPSGRRAEPSLEFLLSLASQDDEEEILEHVLELTRIEAQRRKPRQHSDDDEYNPHLDQDEIWEDR